MSASMIPADVAEAQILSWVQPLDPERDLETIPLFQAMGRVLATTVQSPLDFPHWDNSAMDGYAVRYADVAEASAETPVILTVVEEIPAGKTPQRIIQSGETARILTGSMLPLGTDTIVIQEETQRQGDGVEILAAPEPQAFVRHRASFRRAGDDLLAAGLELHAPEIAVLAAAQWAQVPVYRRPRVAILSTGDELVMPDQPLQPGQIVDSNQYALAALVQAAGGEPVPLGIIPDDPEALREAIAAALTQADCVLSSGGVSVGDYDYVDRILMELGAVLEIRAVAVKPGKPLTVARFPSSEPSPGQRVAPTLYFGLPGNPVSALVSFWRFVEPALRKLSGRAAGWSPVFVEARSQQDLKAGGQRETYLWGHLASTDQGLTFSLAGGSHSSGNLINLAGTNALAVVPVGTRLVAAGNPVAVMLVGRIGKY
ncbi:gephyrin-like molybdotransferase Glp [Leptolyngbya sp. PCC 6406]|uniref:molybdopterin molybdotransferase MoeA n=1 Tax=Leptolyngbya sp. PCC 6406 TaxID=1173264 RepID=UPI0002ABD8E9|nr:gephyrin-like molybdotransferase Glp [Leptolyngbya sp. PCC 6406]